MASKPTWFLMGPDCIGVTGLRHSGLPLWEAITSILNELHRVGFAVSTVLVDTDEVYNDEHCGGVRYAKISCIYGIVEIREGLGDLTELERLYYNVE